MPQSTIRALAAIDGLGDAMYRMAETLYPLCRSITGDGVRQTLQTVGQQIPLEIVEVPTGTAVFDWTVPKEWNIRDGFIKNDAGERIVDFRKCNLHVLNYSAPVHANLSLEELREHLISLPDHPHWIPYRTSYYRETWGFCLTHNQLSELNEERYEVCIDSTLADGHLTYGEYVLPGRVDDEVLLTAHVCHPSLANDNLSGIALITHLATQLAKLDHHFTYRFLLIPGTIGSITWLARNESRIANIRHGLVLSCLGDSGGPTYKRSRRGDTPIDRASAHVINQFSDQACIEPFSPYGYDERQFCSPGFNLPVGLLERSKYGAFPEYHTSADNMSFISAHCLQESFVLVARILEVLEHDITYRNTNPKCEPQLGKRGLYQAIGGDKDSARKQMAMLWALNLADGSNSILDIAERAGLPFATVLDTCETLANAKLLERVDI